MADSVTSHTPAADESAATQSSSEGIQEPMIDLTDTAMARTAEPTSASTTASAPSKGTRAAGSRASDGAAGADSAAGKSDATAPTPAASTSPSSSSTTQSRSAGTTRTGTKTRSRSGTSKSAADAAATSSAAKTAPAGKATSRTTKPTSTAAATKAGSTKATGTGSGKATGTATATKAGATTTGATKATTTGSSKAAGAATATKTGAATTGSTKAGSTKATTTRATKATGTGTAAKAAAGTTKTAGKATATRSAKAATTSTTAESGDAKATRSTKSTATRAAKAGTTTDGSPATTTKTSRTRRQASTRKSGTTRRAAGRPLLPSVVSEVVGSDGSPAAGAYQGAPETIDWSGLDDRFGSTGFASGLRKKSWVYACAATEDLLLTLAVVNGGSTGTAFLMLTDLRSGEVLIDSSRPGAGGPLVAISDRPGEGFEATYRMPGTTYRISRPEGSSEYRIHVSLTDTRNALPGLHSIPQLASLPLLSSLPTATPAKWVEVNLTLDSAPAPMLTAINELDAGRPLAHSTVKGAAMPAWGTVTVHGPAGPTVFSLDGGLGGWDYTNGQLPRHTSWRWAFATGRLADNRTFGINLVSDFSGLGETAAENALWVDGRLIPITEPARIIINEMAPDKGWYVLTDDGAVHLRFVPVAEHSEALNLGLLRSAFRQPVGHFTGHVTIDGERVAIDRLVGVVEDQDILW